MTGGQGDRIAGGEGDRRTGGQGWSVGQEDRGTGWGIWGMVAAPLYCHLTTV